MEIFWAIALHKIQSVHGALRHSRAAAAAAGDGERAGAGASGIAGVVA